MKTALLALLLATSSLFTANALALEKPKGDVVLTVRGNVENANTESGIAEFDLSMLESIAGRRATMETPWTKGMTELSGPYLRNVLEAAGVHKGSKIVVHALNDYSAEVPMEDAKLDTILATRLNGEFMSVRDKGPIFLVYPFDLDHSLYNETYFSRSVWQIQELEVAE